MKSTNPAFTLFEILVVITIMVVMAATIIPRMRNRVPKAEWSTILIDLNNLVFFARQDAIAKQGVRRLMFKQNTNQQADTVIIQEEVDDPEHQGKKLWRQVKSDLAKTKYMFHESIRLNGFYHNGKRQDDFEDQRGEGHCYILTDGLVEDVIVQLVRKVRNEKTEYVESFIMSPFFGTFSRHEGAVKSTEGL